MVNEQEQDVLVRPQAQQRGSQERAAGQVERALSFLADHPLRLRLARRLVKGRQVDDRQLEAGNTADDLHRLPVDLCEGCAQRFMALDDRAETVAERLRRECAAYSDRARDVVRGGPGLQAIEEPEPFLGEGDRADLPKRGIGPSRRHAARSGGESQAIWVVRPSTAIAATCPGSGTSVSSLQRSGASGSSSTCSRRAGAPGASETVKRVSG